MSAFPILYCLKLCCFERLKISTKWSVFMYCCRHHSTLNLRYELYKTKQRPNVTITMVKQAKSLVNLICHIFFENIIKWLRNITYFERTHKWLIRKSSYWSWNGVQYSINLFIRPELNIESNTKFRRMQLEICWWLVGKGCQAIFSCDHVITLTNYESSCG